MLMAAKPRALPEWADRWADPKTKCECGARCVWVTCWGHDHLVCSRSGWDVGKCDAVKTG